jgi:exodeoxyribonuclease VII small subunit
VVQRAPDKVNVVADNENKSVTPEGATAAQESDEGQRASFEDLMSRLERVVDALERGDLPLEKSLLLFEEGIALSRAAGGRLDGAERKIEELLADGSTVPFAEEATSPRPPPTKPDDF